MRIGFVGGGSGGHFYPLIAVAESLNQAPEKPELYYFGPTAYNQDILDQHSITFIRIPAGKLRRYFSIQNFIDIFRNFVGLLVAFYQLFRVYPDVIFSKGGYTSVPVLLIARWYRIPVVIHESDAVPGKANKLAAPFARYIAISYDDAAQFFPPEKTALTGIPMRFGIIQPHQNPFTALGLDPAIPVIYVTGGSLGAERINNLVLSSLTNLLPHYQILHQTGPVQEGLVKESVAALINDQTLRNRYHVIGTGSVDFVSAALAAASLVISRAGSTTMFEIAIHGKPSIIIPIPEVVSHDQRTNAYAYARTGAASVLEEDNLTPNLLTGEINSIMTDQTKYQEMAGAAKRFTVTDAAPKIAAQLIQIGNEHGS
ncbi:MAG: UDP-N-acetylglucosamine--N-acetylmuramyl-(pentapeptide) pyrophosphoryl-undecaprenol N-acetylglucosamine transferase [Patescibacteria group bacterium]